MIQILNKRSSTHPNHCEDNYWIQETDKFIVGAVLDGCSTGINSQWASQTLNYILESSIKKYVGQYTENLLDTLLTDIWMILPSFKRMLNLTDMHLLSTIVLFVFDREKQNLIVKFVGDGVIYINGQEIINDEQNIPDYLAYHLNTDFHLFREWILSRRTESFDNVDNFAICSDGIHSFCNLKNPHIPQNIAIDYLIKDQSFSNLKNGLARKFNILTNQDEELKLDDEHYWWDIKDDLTIIRYATL